MKDMNEKHIVADYEYAKEVYKSFGVDADAALKAFDSIYMSVHCWQGNDVKSLENIGEAESQNLVTGNYKGAARNGDELRKDIDEACSLSPFRHKINIHSMYAERNNPRNDLCAEDFRNWIDWAKERGYGIDFNPSFFTHPMMNNGFSLASPDKSTRDYWIDAGIDSREISLAIGKELGIKCINNFWIPDGLKDTPADRFKYRDLLADSLDKIFARKYTAEEKKYTADTLEGKVFGIGTESFVVGSHEFYYGYALKNNLGICLDTGHFHPNESVADKLSSYSPFIDDILLHISRGIHWDSDHVVTQSDELFAIMHEMKAGNLYGKVSMGLDYFDASINRIAAWAIGLRASAKAILASLLEPSAMLNEAETEGNFAKRLMLYEESKNLPLNAVWNYMLAKKNVPCSGEAIAEIARYEAAVLCNR